MHLNFDYLKPFLIHDKDYTGGIVHVDGVSEQGRPTEGMKVVHGGVRSYDEWKSRTKEAEAANNKARTQFPYALGQPVGINVEIDDGDLVEKFRNALGENEHALAMDKVALQEAHVVFTDFLLDREDPVLFAEHEYETALDKSLSGTIYDEQKGIDAKMGQAIKNRIADLKGKSGPFKILQRRLRRLKRTWRTRS